jgi:hypothetical protein
MRSFVGWLPVVKRESFIVLLLLLPCARPAPAFADPAIVRESRGLGIIDSETREILVPPKYEELAPLDKNRYMAVLHDRCGIIDSRGNILIEFQYYRLWTAGPDHFMASVKFENKYRKGYKYGLLDKEGNILIPLVYDQFEPFQGSGMFKVGDLAEFKAGLPVYRYGVINLKNDVLVPIQYDVVGPPVREPGKSVASITATRGRTTEILEVEIDTGKPGKEEAVAAGGKKAGGRIEKFKTDGKFGFRSPGGGVLCEAKFEDAWDFKEGLARVKYFGKWGFVDETGKMPIDPEYDYAWDFSDGKAKVRLPDGSTRFVGRDGRLLEE